MHFLQNSGFSDVRKKKKKKNKPKHKTIPQNIHRITKSNTFMLEGPLDPLVQTPLLKQSHLQQAVLDHGQLGFEYFSG